MTDIGVAVFAEWGVLPQNVVLLPVSPFSSHGQFIVSS